jgi:hypothetical protein
MWGSGESVSGTGSEMAYTENVRKLVAKTITLPGVQKFIDSPCGDCNWQHTIEGFSKVEYTGLDIVPDLITKNKAKFADRSNMNFMRLDFSNNPYPFAPDVILCRDMIQHNTLEDGLKAYINMEASDSKYLITTWHQHDSTDPAMDNTYNVNTQPGGMYLVDVFLHPFNFSMPDYWIREGKNGEDPDGKTVGVWKLPALGMGNGKRFVPSPDEWSRARKEIISSKKN